MTNSSARSTDAASTARALAERADSVALALLGQPSSKSHRELRWGRHGSISMRLRGDKRGLWHDFERGEGGDVIDLIARQHDVGVGEAIRIARRDYLSVSELRMAPRWPPPCARPAAADDAEGRIKAALRI
jgi:hypothetical protein